MKTIKVAQIKKEAEAAVLQWVADNDGRIGERIKSMLDSQVKKVVGELLGFDAGWGGWKIDHCNGRSGESAAGDWLRQQAGSAVNEWLTAQAGKLPTLDAKDVRALRSEYKEVLLRNARSVLFEHARKQCENIAEQLIKDALPQETQEETSK